MAPIILYAGDKESKKSLVNMMPKSTKFPVSGNLRAALISDYSHPHPHPHPHPVETTAESEGFGSSGRVDTEITLSEDSCSPKRKCISLNGDVDVDSHDRFGVPFQVLSFSKLSRFERKDLEVRLRRELDEVRMFQRRVGSLSASAGVLSSTRTSDIRGCSDGKKRPPVEQAVRGKKPPSSSLGGHGRSVIKGFRDSRKQSTAMLLKRCENLLCWLMEHQFAWVFNEPVDVVKLNIPDYFTVIKRPMDLGTVRIKLNRGEYKCPMDFAADVRLTFSNAMTYNPQGNDVHFMAQTLSKNFEQRWKVIQKKMSTNTDVQVLPAPVPVPVPAVVSDYNNPPFKKKKVAPVGYVGKSEPVKREMTVEPVKRVMTPEPMKREMTPEPLKREKTLEPVSVKSVMTPEPVKKVMTDDERHKLSTELEALISELPDSIVDFLKENSSGDQDDEIEIDIDALSDDVLFKLRKLLDDFLLEKMKNESKAEPCEMELQIESGFSNSSIQAGKGDDAVEEDVDIGASDHPVSSFPPVEVEIDTANKNSRCSSPSSSSSDSGSSSNDSESSSSESEGAKALSPGNNNRQSTVEVKTNMGQNQSDDGLEVEQNQPRSSLSQAEQSCQTKPLSVDVDGCKEGESAPSERQISPDKLYRAALLRSRFADTILKAQEKTLEKDEKRDPEKLRLEREELERRQREAKARLQAEARAAEQARRKAEAEAVAEAKRKRELEREAARLALQKMEKTVDINENCQFMEDLEMLSAAPVDDLSSFISEASPNDSPNGGLGSFRFRGNSNPLEQLGLYRKDDDEEEEEVEAPHNPSAANDVEEGEID